MDATLVQCLLFSLEKSSESFVLIPSIAVEEHSNVCQLFTQNSITILTNNEEYPSLQEALERDQVEVLELLVMTSACDSLHDGIVYEYPSVTTPYIPITVERGNEKLVKQRLSSNAAVYDLADYFSQNRSWKKHLCIDDGNAEIMDRLLSFRADIRYRNPLGGTILHLAVRTEIDLLVKLLLKHGASVDAVNNDGSTALHLAVESWSSFTIASSLVETGNATVNVRKEDGSTSLLLAVKKGHSNIVSLLLRNKADVNIGNSDGLTPLHAAAMLYHPDVAEELLKHGANVDATVSYCYAKGVTPLWVAVEKGSLPMVQCLLDKGANPSIPWCNNQTILQLAVNCVWRVDQFDIFKCILKHLPDCNNRSGKKLRCHDRGLPYDDQILKLLTEHGFIIDVDEWDETELLFVAIAEHDDTAVKRLLESGADVNRVYRFSDTRFEYEKSTMPLFRAIECHANDIAELLISHGADVNAKLDLCDQKTLLHKTLMADNAEAAMILLAQNVNVSDESIFPKLFRLPTLKNSPEWEAVLLRKINMNVSLPQLFTIFKGCPYGSIKRIREILMHCDAIDFRDYSGETALHLACGNNMGPQVIKYLVQNCADVEARNFWGATPLFKAVWTVGEHVISNITELLQYGANINATNYFLDFFKNIENCCLDRVEVFEHLLQFNFSDTEFIRKINVNQIFNENKSDLVNDWDKAYLKSAQILAQHMVKLKAAFPHKADVLDFCSEINRRSASIIAQLLPRDEDNRCLSLLDFQHQCEEEIARLKSHRIGSSWVSYYDVLTKNVRSVSCYLKNPSILESLKSKHYKTEFPIYAKIISHQFEKGRFRRELLNQGLKQCHLLAGVFKDLPFELREEVLSFLSNRELEVAVFACKGISNRQ